MSSSNHLLIIEDDPLMAELLAGYASEIFEAITVAHSGAEALRLAEECEPVAALVDLGLPDMKGQQLLRRLHSRDPGCVLVVVTGEEDPQTIQNCLGLGASDYLSKPIEALRFQASLRSAHALGGLRRRIRQLGSSQRKKRGIERYLGSSREAENARQLVRRASASDVTVLLLGESGSGKEVLAQALHAESQRSLGPFVAVNCGAIPEGLVEAQLFGYEKGAFTGAERPHAGFFEQADGGTIFLDEIAELRMDHQVRLLRVLQERCIRRIGATRDVPIDLRVVAATHHALERDIEKGIFRQDLFYRLSVFPIQVPALRERGDDILELAEHFLQRHGDGLQRRLEGMEEDARTALLDHPWNGNVRELENVIQRAILLEDSERLTLPSLPGLIPQADSLGSAPEESRPDPLGASAFARPKGMGIASFADEEREIYLRALQATGWKVAQAADGLGIGRATLYRKIRRFGLRRDSA